MFELNWCLHVHARALLVHAQTIKPYMSAYIKRSKIQNGKLWKILDRQGFRNLLWVVHIYTGIFTMTEKSNIKKS